MRVPARILIADDQPMNVDILQTRLAVHGYEIFTATDGEEALAAARAQQPDLILLDIMMEGMDGWEVLKLLKLEHGTRDIPVVILSARVEPRDKIRGLQEGAVDYITKPFSVRDMLETIEAVLERSPGNGSGR